jgi:hypothetical protein
LGAKDEFGHLGAGIRLGETYFLLMHIDVHYYFNREKVQEEVFGLEHVGTSENISDILTKSLERIKHYFCNGAISTVWCMGTHRAQLHAESYC